MMLKGIFDTHAHYDDPRFDEDRDELINSLRTRGVSLVLNISAELRECYITKEFTEKYDFFYGAVGIHPQSALEVDEKAIKEIEQLAKSPKIVAIGEIGLDYYYETPLRDVQIKAFEKQLELVKKLYMPVIIHSRDASEDTIKLLKKHNIKKAVIHCYTGSTEIVREYLKMGYYISFTGVLTFKNAKHPIEALKEVPLDRLFLETDCPYMAPEPYRGSRCDSSMITSIANKMAEIKCVTPQEIVDITRENAIKFFGI